MATPVPAVKSAAGKPLVDTLFLWLLLSALFVVTVRPPLVRDPDIWLHLKTGQLILANHSVPVSDTFSGNAKGAPWFAYSWLFDVLVSAIYDASGYRGLLVLTNAAMLAFISCLTAFLASFVNLPRAMILSFCSFLALAELKSPRSWLFTILFFTIELALLWIARERNRPALLLPVIPLFALWANLHIQFVYGLGLIGLFALDADVPARVRHVLGAEAKPPLGSSRLWLLLGASGLATLLNPYGWNIYRVVGSYATQNAPLQYVQEFQSMPFRSISNWMALAMICAAIFALGAARRKSLLMITLLAFSCFFGFRSQRDVWFPVIVSALALASAIHVAQPAFVRSRCLYWIAIPLSLATITGIFLADTRFTREALDQGVAKYFPVKGCDYIESHHLPGPLFNTYYWGDYLIRRLPGMPVSIDGRTDLSNDYLARAVDTARGAKDWRKDPDLRKANTILLEDDSSLASILRVDPAYRQVYEDSTAAIFQPVTPAAPMPSDGKGGPPTPASQR